MAIESLLLQRKIEKKRSELNALNEKRNAFAKRKSELEASIEEVRGMPEETEEEALKKREAEEAVDAEVAKYETEKAEAAADDEAAKALEDEIRGLEDDLAAQENEQTTPEEPAKEAREVKTMTTEVRNFSHMSIQERDAFFAREDVQGYLNEVRAIIKEKRAINNVGLTIPEVFLGVLRANIEGYSKLYKHVTVRQVSGTARMAIMSQFDEAIWTECCANLNELTLTFYQEEYDCFKVGGYYALCEAQAEDSDLMLANEIMTALGQATGLAIDKAIIYGRNTSANQKMPLGVMTRLVQTEAPSGYPATARPWADLHTSNIIVIPAGAEGSALIRAIVKGFGAAKGKYSRGNKVWCMNEKTYTEIAASTISTNANGQIVVGVTNSMPVVGGVFETLEFIPDNVIIAGYFDLYVLAERAGQKFASSEHVRFLADQIVFKSTARYDGGPAIPEGFVAFGINGATPNADMTFAADVANQGG